MTENVAPGAAGATNDSALASEEADRGTPKHPRSSRPQDSHRTSKLQSLKFADGSKMKFMKVFPSPVCKECISGHWEGLEELNHGLSGLSYADPFHWNLKLIFNKSNIILSINR